LSAGENSHGPLSCALALASASGRASRLALLAAPRTSNCTDRCRSAAPLRAYATDPLGAGAIDMPVIGTAVASDDAGAATFGAAASRPSASAVSPSTGLARKLLSRLSAAAAGDRNDVVKNWSSTRSTW